jgi:hypothetical protein
MEIRAQKAGFPICNEASFLDEEAILPEPTMEGNKNPSHRLLDKYMRERPALSSGVCISGRLSP